MVVETSSREELVMRQTLPDQKIKARWRPRCSTPAVDRYNSAVPTSRLYVIANIRAQPEHIDTVREVLTGYVQPTRAEAGCIVYDLFQNRSDAAHFTFVEEWADEASLDAHSKSAHITAGRERLKGLAAAEVLKYSRLA
jgi:quinol monooxygenase YgiN